MIQAIATVILLAIAIAVPLAWRVAKDRQNERALQLEAEIKSAARQALGGESLLSVQVQPPGTLHLHPGRVRLSAPRGWESLIEPVWQRALAATPEDYELVMTPIGAPEDRPASKEIAPVR
jgi:hypothetical protein